LGGVKKRLADWREIAAADGHHGDRETGRMWFEKLIEANRWREPA
jgi:hypothetical protein